MSLRLRLFLAFALLLAAFAALLLFGLLRLNRDLNTAFGESAVQVGHTIVTVLSEQRDENGPTRRIERRIEQRTDAAGRVTENHSERVFAMPSTDESAGDAQTSVDTRTITADVRSDADPGQLRYEFRTHAIDPGAADSQLSVRRLRGDDGSQALWVSGDGIDQAIELPSAGVEQALLDYSESLLWAVLGLLALGLAVAFWMAHRITAPLRGLSLAAGELAGGRLGAQARVAGSPEVRDTIDTFNRMSTQLADLQQQAEHLRQRRALAELGEVGRGLAHALRNPLHAVGLALEEMADRHDDDPASQTLKDTARDQLKRIDQSLRSFLALAAGEAAVESDIDLRALSEDVLLEVSQTSGRPVRLQLEDGAPLQLRGVPAELRILLHTLIVNAVEASPDSSEVSLSLHPSTDGALIQVRDQGPGVSEAIRERLFEPHVSSKPEGAGMGLYLARRLASLRYGGDIELGNAEGGGCIATLKLSPREPNR